jgi:hypothetical protein
MMKDRTIKEVLLGTSVWEGLKERKKEGEYDGSILYSCMKTEQ